MTNNQSTQPLQDWGEVDDAMRQIGELKIQINAAEGQLTERTNQLKAATKAKTAPLQAQQKLLITLVEGYCHQNKATFAEKRSKELTFGSIGFRITHKMPWPRVAKKLQDLLDSLKNLGLNDCIRREEVVDKDKVAELDASTLAKLGLKKETVDSFRIEPDMEKIQAS